MGLFMNKALKIIIPCLSLMFLLGCGGGEKRISESEKKLIKLAKETSDVIGMIKKSESNYAERKSSNEWKQAYQTKREEIDRLQIQLASKINEGHYLEQFPEEGLRTKVQLYLHAAENIKTYMTVTNADLTRIFTDSPPPAVDVYNRERYLTTALNELQEIAGRNAIVGSSKIEKSAEPKSDNNGRYMLNEQGPDETGKQIRAGKNQADAWKEAVGTSQSAVDSKAKETEKKIRR
jgi:hypothetical protein